MMISFNQQMQLAEFIKSYLIENFDTIFLSGNLKNTIYIDFRFNGDIVVGIPAKMYDIPLYRKEKVIVFNKGENSYAEEVNITGGFSGKHVNYIDDAIVEAIRNWIGINKIDVKEVKYNYD